MIAPPPMSSFARLALAVSAPIAGILVAAAIITAALH